jgi:hypothetical protein
VVVGISAKYRRFRPFESGLWDTQRGAFFTPDGVAFIPKCRVDVTFRRGSQSKGWYWEVDYWKKGEEKTFDTQKGQLLFDPYDIEVVISFPGTSYQYKATLVVSEPPGIAK